MYKLTAIFLLIAAGAFAQDRTLKLSGTDFFNGKPIIITNGQYDKIHVENMYAQQIGIRDENKKTADAEVQNVPDLMSNFNSFDIDISCLAAGKYTIHTWACYFIGELPLTIEIRPE